MYMEILANKAPNFVFVVSGKFEGINKRFDHLRKSVKSCHVWD